MLDPHRTLTELRELQARTADRHGAQRVAYTAPWHAARAYLLACHLYPQRLVMPMPPEGEELEDLLKMDPHAMVTIPAAEAEEAHRHHGHHQRTDTARRQITIVQETNSHCGCPAESRRRKRGSL